MPQRPVGDADAFGRGGGVAQAGEGGLGVAGRKLQLRAERRQALGPFGCVGPGRAHGFLGLRRLDGQPGDRRRVQPPRHGLQRGQSLQKGRQQPLDPGGLRPVEVDADLFGRAIVGHQVSPPLAETA